MSHQVERLMLIKTMTLSIMKNLLLYSINACVYIAQLSIAYVAVIEIQHT